MSNQLQKFGAQASKPARYGILWQNRLATGIWTQRSPLRDAASSRIEEEFYGARGDALIDGSNTEISTALTLVRRPGSSVYNTSGVGFPAINRFYENRVSVFNAAQTTTTESIQVLADTNATIYDVTAPSTHNTIFTKTPGAGSTFFQSVGNELFFSDGPEQKKLITPNLIWAPNQTFNTGNQVLDSNGNLQIVQGTGTADISEIQVVSSTLGVAGGPTLYFLKITFTSDVFWTQGTPVSFSGVTTYAQINNQTQTVVVNPTYLAPAPTVAYFTTGATATYGPSADTGEGTSTSSTGSGLSGSSVPSWNGSLAGYTTDNQLTWQNFGPPLYNWAVPAPTLDPTITPVAGNRYWQPGFTIPSYYTILDSNGNIQLGTAGLVTGATVPTWITVYSTATSYATYTSDGQASWLNLGPLGSWSGDTVYFPLRVILDSNKNIQYTVGGGTSGGSEPVWSSTLGDSTSDGTVTWICYGPGSVITSQGYYYAYSWVSTDGSVTTSSPVAALNPSTPVLGPAGNPIAILSGGFLSDPQITQAWIWRSVQGGSSASLFFDSSIPNPTPGTASNWAFTDLIPDTFLNELIEAPVADQNNPPPVGITALTYHLNRVWGAVGNIVFNSQTSGIVGNPYTSWDPEDFFQYPGNVIRLFPTSNGLIVFTISDIYVIQGLGTASSPFFSTPFLQNIGLGNYDGFTVNGAIAYLYTTDNQIVSIDPSSGVSEVGFPIGNQLGPNNGLGTFNPSTAFLTWHFDGSEEKALYVSDRIGNWWRMLPTPSPETGTTWCPMATFPLGFSAVQSVETSPGVHTLLLGPFSEYLILKRDSSVYTDIGVTYNAYAVVGSLVLAQPGQLAYVKLITTDSMAIGTPLTLSVQLDEISYLSGIGPNGLGIFTGGVAYRPGDTVNIFQSGASGATALVTSVQGGTLGPVTGLKVLNPGVNYTLSTNLATTSSGNGIGLTVNITALGGLFEPMTLFVPDPTQLTASQTTNAQRFYLSQTQDPSVCRHLQILVNFASDTVKNELLSLTLFGSFEQEL